MFSVSSVPMPHVQLRAPRLRSMSMEEYDQPRMRQRSMSGGAPGAAMSTSPPRGSDGPPPPQQQPVANWTPHYSTAHLPSSPVLHHSLEVSAAWILLFQTRILTDSAVHIIRRATQKGGNCSLEKWAVTAFWFCTADIRRVSGAPPGAARRTNLQ